MNQKLQTYMEVGAPCSLPLGLVCIEAGGTRKMCLLGVAVQHPPMHLLGFARRTAQVTGARADLATVYAHRFRAYHQLSKLTDIEIELATPAYMGLGSDGVLGLSVARLLAAMHNLPTETAALVSALGLEPRHALSIAAFDRGGLVLLDLGVPPGVVPPVVQRYEIAHPEKEAWAFVFYLPRVSNHTPPTLEDQHTNALFQAAPFLEDNTEAGAQLATAVQQNDVALFAQALTLVRQQTEAALLRAGHGVVLSEETQQVLAVMQEMGAVAWGRNFGGLGLYGLIEGAHPSRLMRYRLRQQFGAHGGWIMATITDNRGGVHMQKNSAPSISAARYELQVGAKGEGR
ncbi:MAG: hypothetical protein HC876_18550 [Chloroflexaceae bacterium]|nr:hypothetical protein [Chloroflexaceae bacterium]